MNPLVVIPARIGSKGLPKKNIKILNGKPLILYTLEAARKCFHDSEICVSTDSVEIKEVVEDSGFPVSFLRPESLSTDKVGSFQVVEHAVDYWTDHYYTPDVLVLLQPTSPLRNDKHIKEALDIFKKKGTTVISVRKSKSNPYFTLFEEDEHGFLKKSKEGNYLRRQDTPGVYEINGAIYIGKWSDLKKSSGFLTEKVVKYPMDDMSSVDIDNSLDFELCKMIMNDQLG